jgi:tetratricopeptide (TPR) repeat protein
MHTDRTRRTSATPAGRRWPAPGRVAFGLAVWAIALGHASQQAPADDARDGEAVTYAREQLETGSYREAARAAEAALAEAPADATALELLVRAELARGRVAAARELLAETLADEDAGAARETAALVLGELTAAVDPERAEELFRGVIERQPDGLRARAGLAGLLVMDGRREQAREVAESVFRIYRESPAGGLGVDSFVALARTARAAELLPELAAEHTRPFAEEARRFYQEAWRASDTNPDILCEWGELYLRKWDIPEARRLLKRALERDPRHAEAHALLAETYLEDLYGGADGYDKARRAIAQALVSDAGHPRALTLRADLLMTDELYEDAIAQLDRVLERRPRDARALAGRVAALEMLSREDEAQAERGRAVRMLPPPLEAEFHRRLAGVLDSRFRYKRAFDEAKRGVEADPHYPPAWGRLGLAAMRTGDLEEARTFLGKAHAADPYDLFVYNVLQLLDVIERDYVSFETKHFRVKMHRDEEPWLRPYLEPFCDRAWDALSRRWGVELDSKIALEVYPNLQDFSVRAVGHRFIPASGVTFWRTVALASPAAFPPGAHGWAQVLWHELAHVATLERSGYRVPRWLTEGTSVLEEAKGDARWVRDWDVMLLEAISRDRIMPLTELNEGFSRPRFPGQVMLGYFQGGMICRYLEESRGFASILGLLDGYREREPLRELCRKRLGVEPERFDREFLAWLKQELGVERYRGRIDTRSELSRLRRAAKRSPEDPDALARYGLACCDMSRWADAEIQAGRLLELDGASGDARLIDARLSMHRGDRDKAMELFAAALAFKTRDPLHAHLARAKFFSTKDPEASERYDLRKALAELTAAHRLFPRGLEIMGRMHELLGELDREDEQRALEEKVAALRPNDFGARIEIAGRMLDAGDLERARLWLEQVPFVEPRHPVAHAELAKLYARLGEDEALIERELRVLEATDPKGELLKQTRAEVEKIRSGEPEAGESKPEGTTPEEAAPDAPSPSPAEPAPSTPTPEPVEPF